MLFESSALFPILGIHILAGLVCVVTGIASMVSAKRAGLHPRCGTIYHWGLACPRHLGRSFGGGALDGRPPAVSPGVRFPRCVISGTHGSKTKLAALDRHTHHFYGLLLHCYAYGLLRRGRRELTRSELVAPLNLLVLARPDRNAFHGSRTRPPPAEISAWGSKVLKALYTFVIRCMMRKEQQP